MQREISHLVRWCLSGPIYVGNRAGNHSRCPFRAHHRVQAAVSFPVFCPELEFFKRDCLTRFGDGSSPDAVDDEFAPEFVFGAELVFFPRSLTS